MGDNTEAYAGELATIVVRSARCIHSRNCVLYRPDVLVPNAPGAWVHLESASRDAIAALAHNCPSGAISYERHDAGAPEQAPAVNVIRVNGPLAIHAALDVAGDRHLYQLYAAADPAHTGPATVSVLWDLKTRTIVNNESSEIIRMLNRVFEAWGDPNVDLYPTRLAPEIDAVKERIYATVNNGVYKAGFATIQAAYEEAVVSLFAMLDEIDERLATQRSLVGRQITEPGLFQSLQMQHPAASGLPEPAGMAARHLSDSRHHGDGRLGADQAALLRQPALGEPDRDHPRGTEHRPYGVP